ncbi:MAG TPA: hypothetical protein DHV48_18935 [Prolixibacteraceae bacterium]|jgi:hypothetical protein|nr:hypothetical protein [Prolixibacteraceae bacterium]
MNWFKKIADRIIDWQSPGLQLRYVDELPEMVTDKVIYIVGEMNFPWLLAFKCPCGCQNLIQLNLLKDAEPCWRFKIDKKKKINIYPSVWRINGCKSHFFIRKSKIQWARF